MLIFWIRHFFTLADGLENGFLAIDAFGGKGDGGLYPLGGHSDDSDIAVCRPLEKTSASSRGNFR